LLMIVPFCEAISQGSSFASPGKTCQYRDLPGLENLAGLLFSASVRQR